jgi:hypothetical protein
MASPLRNLLATNPFSNFLNKRRMSASLAGRRRPYFRLNHKALLLKLEFVSGVRVVNGGVS